MSYTSPSRPGEPEVPAYRWVQKPDPDRYGGTSGCYGCAFKKQLDIRCSRIPCQRFPNHVAELVTPSERTTP